MQKVHALGDKEVKGQLHQLSPTITPSSQGRVPTAPSQRLSRESTVQTGPEHRPAETQARALTRVIQQLLEVAYHHLERSWKNVTC